MKRHLTLSIALFASVAALSNSHAQQRMVQYSTGTGFFVSVNGDLVTNHHVIEKCHPGTVQVSNKNFDWMPATIRTSDATKDLAVLRSERRSPHVASLEAAQSSIYVGDHVVVIGYPGKRAFTGVYKFIKSDVKWVGNTKQFGQIIEFRNVVAKGNSGGPLLDQSGNVIGVVTGYFYGRPEADMNNAFAVSLPELKNFLRKNKIMIRRSIQKGQRSDKFLENKARNFIVSVRCVVSEKII